MIYFSHRESLSSHFEPFVSKPFSGVKTGETVLPQLFPSAPFLQLIAFYVPMFYTHTKVSVTTDSSSEVRSASSLIQGIKLTLRFAKGKVRQGPRALRFAAANSSIFRSVHHPHEPTFSVRGFHKRDVFTTGSYVHYRLIKGSRTHLQTFRKLVGPFRAVRPYSTIPSFSF